MQWTCELQVLREEDEADVRCCLCLRRVGHSRLSKSDGADDVIAQAQAYQDLLNAHNLDPNDEAVNRALAGAKGELDEEDREKPIESDVNKLETSGSAGKKKEEPKEEPKELTPEEQAAAEKRKQIEEKMVLKNSINSKNDSVQTDPSILPAAPNENKKSVNKSL